MGDNDGQNVVGLELLDASDGDGVGDSVADGDVGFIIGRVNSTVNAGAFVNGDGSAIVIENTGVGSGVNVIYLLLIKTYFILMCLDRLLLS